MEKTPDPFDPFPRPLFVRGMPRDVLAKMKAAAALNHQTLSEYVQELFDTHVKELERKGQLPKGK